MTKPFAGPVHHTNRGGRVSRAELQRFAENRIIDAETLLTAGRWSGAYYLAGYAVECGLKSCVLHHIERTGMIFKDKEFLNRLGKCWTHDLKQLVDLANLKDEQDTANRANANLFANWGVVCNWKETSRYEEKTALEARGLYDAITHVPDGVLAWIRLHW
jgi:HEPN domain-containing protein